MTTSEFIGLLESRGFKPRKAGKDWVALCPAHDDKKPSMSVSQGEGGRVLVKCHAGCGSREICEALGIKLADLFPARAPKKSEIKKGLGKQVATYNYCDEKGSLLAQKLRYEPKTFRWRHPDPDAPNGSPTWIYKRPGKMPLYHLPQVAVASVVGGTVWLVEGEKDADALASVGLVATTGPDGADKSGRADKWLDMHTDALRGTHVVLVADKDDVGRVFARSVAERIHDQVESLRLIEVPDVGGKFCKDPADFLAAGGTREDLEAFAAAGPSFPCVYDSGRRAWWTTNCRSSWIEITECGIRRSLKAEGFSPECGRLERLSPLDTELLRLQRKSDVAYAGPLAGWSKGIHEQSAGRILVTSEAALGGWNGKATLGVYPTTKFILENMLGEEQFAVFVGWLNMRRSALLRRTWTPGQALVFCGPALCGKSLAQRIITLALGGREAKPWRYMTGTTDFNGELFGSEHLVIEDEAASTDIRARRHFGAHIKSMLFSRSQSCHAKNRQALTLEPIWALSISVNDEPENLMVLPPLDESLKDKVILLLCEKHEMPIKADTVAGQERLRAAIEAELPAFAAFVDAFEIPDELRDERCGIIPYQHGELLSALETLAPETELLETIDEVIFGGHPARTQWSGTAAQLEGEVRRSVTYGYRAERLFHFRAACGTYLGRLEKRLFKRISRKILDGITHWTLLAPGVC